MILDKYKHISTPDFINSQVNNYINLKPKANDNPYSFLNITNNDSTNFLYDSFTSKNKKGSPYNTIPFNTKYPSFNSLNSTQKQFYFYWRNEAVNGNFIDTEISYIFLFSYELINYSYCNSASFNISMLVHLLDRYSNRFPKLKEFLPTWISDMLFELNEFDLANEYMQEESVINKDYFDMKNQSSIKNITMNNWWRFIKYPHKSAFFVKNSTKIYTIFKDLLEFLNSYYLSLDSEIGLFEKAFPLIKINSERKFFNGAVLKRDVELKMSSITKREFDQNFSLVLTETMKISENYLRSLKGYEILEVDFNLIEYDLVIEMINSLSRFKNKTTTKIKTKEKESKNPIIPVKVEFDDVNIKTLSSDSVELQKLFEEKYYEEEQEEKVEIKKTSTEIFNIFKEIKDSFDFEELDELSELEKEFILLFENDLKEFSFYSQFLRKKGIIIGSFLLTINEKFEDAFDDVLFELEDDSLEFNNVFEGIFDYLKEE